MVVKKMITPKNNNQRGAAILMVLIVMISLSVMLPAGFGRVALSYDQVARVIEKKKDEMLLDSILGYTHQLEKCLPSLSFEILLDESLDEHAGDIVRHSGEITCSKAGSVVIRNGVMKGVDSRVLYKKHISYALDKYKKV